MDEFLLIIIAYLPCRSIGRPYYIKGLCDNEVIFEICAKSTATDVCNAIAWSKLPNCSLHIRRMLISPPNYISTRHPFCVFELCGRRAGAGALIVTHCLDING